MKQSAVPNQIPLWALFTRFASNLVLIPFFPVEIVDKKNSLAKARESAISGKGLILVFTHFSLRDAMEVNRTIIFSDPVLKYLDVANPLSYHQYNKFMDWMAKFYHATFAPIVNQSTITKKGYEHLAKGTGLNNFVALGKKILNKGGAVPLALNATRKEKLDRQDKQRPIGYFIASLQALNVKNYGLLLVAPAIKGAKNYSKKEVGGMNFNKTCILNIVNYYTIEELLNKPEVNNKIGNIDTFMRSEFAKAVPREYL